MKRARKSEPTVVVFNEPGRKRGKEYSKRQKMSDVKSYQKRTPLKNTSVLSGVVNDEVTDEVNFKQIAQEVREFGITGFTKKDQRKFQQQKSQSLGAKAPKRQKVPYPILMRAKKIRDQRETEQKELEIAMGVFKKKTKHQQAKTNLPKSLGRWVDHSNGLDDGKYKKGVQKLHQKDIAKFKKRTK